MDRIDDVNASIGWNIEDNEAGNLKRDTEKIAPLNDEINQWVWAHQAKNKFLHFTCVSIPLHVVSRLVYFILFQWLMGKNKPQPTHRKIYTRRTRKSDYPNKMQYENALTGSFLFCFQSGLCVYKYRDNDIKWLLPGRDAWWSKAV